MPSYVALWILLCAALAIPISLGSYFAPTSTIQWTLTDIIIVLFIAEMPLVMFIDYLSRKKSK